MAPSFEIGNPQRSLVRIPGSGQDKTLKPICLDVAQIKTCARTLSDIMNFNFESPPDQVQSGTVTVNILPRASFIGGVVNSAAASEDLSQSSTRRKRPAEDDGPSAKRLGIVTPREKYVLKVIHLPMAERREKLERLSHQEILERKEKLKNAKEALKEQNEILERKVARFKEIILSKSKLNEFLSTLRKMEELAVI